MLLVQTLLIIAGVAARTLGGPEHPNDTDKWVDDDDDDSKIGKAVLKIPSDKDFMSKFEGVRDFVKNDLPLFHAVEMSMIPEDRTELRLYTTTGLVSEAFEINDWDAEEIEDTLLDYGFFKKQHIDDEVPEEYVEGTFLDEDADHDEL